MRRPIRVVGLASLGVMTSAQSQDARPTLTLGTAVAQRGKVAYGELQVVTRAADTGGTLHA